MLRTLLISAAIAAAAPAAFAQNADLGPVALPDADGITVPGRSPEAYVIVIDTRYKDEAMIRREISAAAVTACNRAPRTGNNLDNRIPALQGCVTQAQQSAHAQLAQIMESRRQGWPITVAAAF